jgi:hypothetical protein
MLSRVLPAGQWSSLSFTDTLGVPTGVFIREGVSVYWVVEGAHTGTRRAVLSKAVPLPNTDIVLMNVVGIRNVMCFEPVAPTLHIRNKGTEPVTRVRVTYEFERRPPETLFWQGSMLPGDTAAIYLPGTLLDIGRHKFKCRIDLTDGIRETRVENNTFQSKSFRITPPVVVPCFIDFEESSPVYLSGPRDVKPLVVAPGQTGKALRMELSRMRRTEEAKCLIPLSGFKQVFHPVLNFRYACLLSSHGNKDRLSVEISTDCGDAWRQIWVDSSTTLATGFSKSGRNPQHQEWRSVSVPLNLPSTTGPVMLRFTARADGGRVLLLDEISVITDPAFAQVKMSLSPAAEAGTFAFHIKDALSGAYLIRVMNADGEVVYIQWFVIDKENFADVMRLKYLPAGKYPVVLSSEAGDIGSTQFLVLGQ